MSQLREMPEPTETCPRCGEIAMHAEPRRALNAVSRTDNRTYVCPPCGTNEGVEAYLYGEIKPQWAWHADSERHGEDEE